MRPPNFQKREIWLGRMLLLGEVLAIASFLIFRFNVLVPSPDAPAPPQPPPSAPAITPPVQPDKVSDTVHLKRGDFTVYRFMPGQPEFAAHPKAIIIFGSGDGGFLDWENRVSKALQSEGYEIIGFDCNAYARSDYDLATLQADMTTIAQSARSPFGDHPPPLIIGGWSMGAEQAVPTAGGPHRPPDLMGLLLISPGYRGRYGIRETDRVDIPPMGHGSFAMKEFAHKLDGLRVAQWNANLDLPGSKSWLDSLTATHKAFSYPHGLHDYEGASDEFIAGLKESLTWILSPTAAGDEPK